MSEPKTTTWRMTIRTRDIERFADVHMGIKLMPHQLRLIDALAQGKTMFIGKRAGLRTAKRVLQAYVDQDSGYIKHFKKTHFTAVTVDGRKFVYCPVGNIVSWSEGDYDHKWCEWCKKGFTEIADSKKIFNDLGRFRKHEQA